MWRMTGVGYLAEGNALSHLIYGDSLKSIKAKVNSSLSPVPSSFPLQSQNHYDAITESLRWTRDLVHSPTHHHHAQQTFHAFQWCKKMEWEEENFFFSFMFRMVRPEQKWFWCSIPVLSVAASTNSHNFLFSIMPSSPLIICFSTIRSEISHDTRALSQHFASVFLKPLYLWSTFEWSRAANASKYASLGGEVAAKIKL